MLRRTTSWGLSLGVSSTILVTSVFATAGVEGLVPVAHAVEKTISQEEAIRQAQKWVTIPGDYKLERARLSNPEEDYTGMGNAHWNVTWEKSKVGTIHVTLDAVTGKLTRYYSYLEDNQVKSTKTKLTEEETIKLATQFLEKVTTEEERSHLSKPNEYVDPDSYYFRNEGQRVNFTRMVGGIPFIGNGFRLMVEENGEIAGFYRDWYDGKLPDASKVIDQAEAEKTWGEKAIPSLIYKDVASMTSNQRVPGEYELVYDYEYKDPQLVDATTGEMINLFGKAASEKKIKPLGTTVAKKSTQKKLITKEEAQKIADQYMQRLPGSYRSDGSSGGGSSSSGGVTIRRWSFDYTPQNGDAKQSTQVEVDINDRGELVEYRINPNSRFDETPKKMVFTWEQAEESATKLVQTILADQLGAIYLIEEEPTQEALQSSLEEGEHYGIQFGVLVNGIPVEDESIEVEVHPETGQAISLNKRDRDVQTLPEAVADHIDAKAAQEVFRKQKKLQLTYFQPMSDWRLAKASDPLLVYRSIGDNGVVKAESGEWYSFVEAQKQQAPSDIAEHPQQAALEFIVRKGWMAVSDGQLGPDKEVTRGEMAMIIAQMTNDIEFRNLRPRFDIDEERRTHEFADVPSSHPHYAAIQKNIEYKLIPKTGNKFEPDRTITRAELADMAARLLGYGDLLDKPELFKTPYQDVQSKHIPAVTLLSGHGLLKGKSAATFEPDKPVTRAEVAELVKMIYDQKQIEN
ncbi:YcdB/YcdC domain-containing protein [Brevibacillus sp. 179-C9.3 HS]|uniref:YcdB/YcdC domain-containing protein n=1 Tax=unclassified Brevibacillus TaxID=2684853 RepID=UPI0039A30471